MNPATRQAIASLIQQAQARFHAGAYDEARALADRVLQLDANSADALHVLGVVAFKEGRLADAEAFLVKALASNRRSAHVLLSLANIYAAQANYETAESTYRRALTLEPRLSAAYLGIGIALRARNRPRDAIACLERYVQRAPADPEGFVQLGLAYEDLRDFDAAAERFRAALKISPDHKAALDCIALLLLRSGKFQEGWPAWVRSWTALPFPHPSAGSAPFERKRVVIYGTAGVGDEVMYCSCLPQLAQTASAITLHCDPRLTPLLERSFPSITVQGFEKRDARRTIGIMGPDEIHVPACLLPAYFPASGERPGGRESFLLPDPEQVALWRRRYDALGSGLKVGLSWRGGVDPINRARRSIPLAAWSAVLCTEGVHFVNLQYGDTAAEVEALDTAPIHCWSDADPLLNLDFFAAQIAALDLVISVSNTTAHMAGALGKTVWALVHTVPHWFWRVAGRTTPWYPSAELFRQPEAGEWTPVLKEVESRLVERIRDGADRRSATH